MSWAERVWRKIGSLLQKGSRPRGHSCANYGVSDECQRLDGRLISPDVPHPESWGGRGREGGRWCILDRQFKKELVINVDLFLQSTHTWRRSTRILVWLMKPFKQLYYHTHSEFCISDKKFIFEKAIIAIYQIRLEKPTAWLESEIRQREKERERRERWKI